MPDDQNNDNDRWIPERGTILDSLLAVADDADNGDSQPKPWQAGHVLEFSSYGGQRTLERRRKAASSGGYSNTVTGNQSTDITGSYTARYNGGSVVIGPPAPPEGEGNDEAEAQRQADLQSGLQEGLSASTDRLSVAGNADINYENRTILMSGSINRLWQGGITKFVGMEGAICGGAFVRTIAGPSMTLSALVSGDVYGGSLRVAAARVHMALLSYRSLDAIAWACGYWGRFSTFVIIPPIKTDDAGATRRSQIGKWLLKISGTMLPLIEIAWGLLMLVVALIKGLFALLAKVGAAIKARLPVIPGPRNEIRTAGVTSQTTAADVTV